MGNISRIHTLFRAVLVVLVLSASSGISATSVQGAEDAARTFLPLVPSSPQDNAAAVPSIEGEIDIAANTVNFTLSGGDATAIAECVDAAKSTEQNNRFCRNIAVARSGKVILRRVNVTVLNADGTVADGKTVDIIISGGDATALAQCINAGSNATKSNDHCVNVALAFGGMVLLANVEIVVQLVGDGSSAVTLELSGGDATSVATCINADSAHKAARCKNVAKARGGRVTLTNTTIYISQ